MNDDSEARRTALALVKLREAGDESGVRILLDNLDADQLRRVLDWQTLNVSAVLASLFTKTSETRLPLIAALFQRSPEEVIQDHLARIILRLALKEQP